MSFVIYVLYMCTYVYVCVMYLRVCARVCVRTYLFRRVTSDDVRFSCAKCQRRFVVVARNVDREWENVRTDCVASVCHTHMGKGISVRI